MNCNLIPLRVNTYLVLLGPSPLSTSSPSLGSLGRFLGIFLGLAFLVPFELLIDSCNAFSSPLSLSAGSCLETSFLAFCWAGAGSPMLAFLFFWLLNYSLAQSPYPYNQHSLPGKRFGDVVQNPFEITTKCLKFSCSPVRL